MVSRKLIATAIVLTFFALLAGATLHWPAGFVPVILAPMVMLVVAAIWRGIGP